MRTSALILLVVSVVGSGLLAACSAPEEPEAEVGGGEDDLTALELKCRGGATTFDVSPAFGGIAIEGVLKSGAVTSSFICHAATPPATDAGADARMDGGDAGATNAGGTLVATCNERPQSAHPGRWEVAITKSGTATKATIKRGSGTDEVIACAAPSRPDAGEGGAAVPTYAEVGPIINRTCGGCHSGIYDSLAKVKTRKTIMLGMITSGAMPMRNRTWKDSADGQKVLDFLRNSPEL